MLILPKVHTNTPNIQDFRFKNIQWGIFQAEYTKKSGYSMVFFRKNRENHSISQKLFSRINVVGRKIRKIGFYGKTSTNIKSFPLQLIPQITIIVEHTDNLHNSQLYTIQTNSHVLSQKNLAFSQSATAIVLQKRKLLTHKIIKQQSNCSYIYCEEDYGKCYKHAPFFFKCTIVSTGVTNILSFAQNTKQTEPAYIANYKINRYNGSFFSYKKQHFH